MTRKHDVKLVQKPEQTGIQLFVDGYKFTLSEGDLFGLTIDMFKLMPLVAQDIVLTIKSRDDFRNRADIPGKLYADTSIGRYFLMGPNDEILAVFSYKLIADFNVENKTVFLSF